LDVRGPSYSDATAIIKKRATNPKYRIDAFKIDDFANDASELEIELFGFQGPLDGLISPKKPEDFRFPEGPTQNQS
jgi:hypothetical protein